jgi:hypothetical protein
MIEKSGTGIERSGTGIEKSGTGIEKSGTGIEKSGTGVTRALAMLVTLTCMLLAMPVFASDTRLAVSAAQGHVLVSVHAEQGVLVGVASAPADDSGYSRVPLYPIVSSGADGFLMGLVPGQDKARTLVQGSGTGDSKESTEPHPGHGLLVQGSGTGSIGDQCTPGSRVLVQGSGTGSSGDDLGCPGALTPWGFAEVVVDGTGTSVIVHKIEGSRAEEFLVAFLPGSSSEVAHSLYRGSSNRAFVAAP